MHLQALIDAVVGEEGNDIKSISPGTSVRRARPRYKVMCEDMRSRETDERLEKLYPLVDQMVPFYYFLFSGL